MKLMEIPAINALYKTTPQEQGVNPEGTGDFPTVLAAAMNLVQETNALQNKANAEQVSSFAFCQRTKKENCDFFTVNFL